MLHTQLHGTHWQIGFQLGAGLARDGHFILDAVPFPITPARLEFARTCLPLCRRWFPPPPWRSCGGWPRGRGVPRTNWPGSSSPCTPCRPAPAAPALPCAGGEGPCSAGTATFARSWKSTTPTAYTVFPTAAILFVGNTTSFLQMEDGVNQFGLAAGLTSVPPSPPRPGLNAGLTLRLLLESCRDVPQALALLGSSPSPPATRWCWPTGLGVSPWRSVPRSAPRSIVPGRRTPSSAPSIPSTSPPWPPSAGRRTTTGGRKSAI